MAEYVKGANEQNLQQFISDSKWDYEGASIHLAKEISTTIGGGKQSILIIDESGFSKKGNQSVGVGRQYLGNLGKIDNGQVGVFSALCHNNIAALTSSKLYLPESWTNEPEKCLAKKVPESECKFKTKDEIAVDLVKWHLQNDILFGWVVVDAGYTHGNYFMEQMVELNVKYVADVAFDYHVYTDKPKFSIPERTSDVGREPTRLKSNIDTVSVQRILETRNHTPWRKIKLRKGTKFAIKYSYCTKRVWIYSDKKEKAIAQTLIIRNGPDGEVKYSLTNASENTELSELAYAQSQRFWIERCFRDGKQECGLKDYQVRSWTGWHRHMLLSMMAQLFSLKLKLNNSDILPLLSYRDIKDLMSYYLGYSTLTEPEILALILNRHKKRKETTRRAYRSRRNE